MNTNAIRMGRRPWPPVIDEPTETPVNAAQFVGQSIPASMVAGQPYDITVTMRNTGSTMWTPQASYRLGSVAAIGGRAGVEPPPPIAPGGDAAFRRRVTARAIA